MNAAAAAPADAAAALARARWALLFGNFAIGCGVMVTAGTLNDLARSLQVSVPVAGQLISVAAVVIALGAPLAAAVVAGFDRRRLLAWSLVWYALGHALCALMPGYAALMPVRAIAVLAAAVFSPQAAAAIAVMAPPEQRGRAITFVFLGWSLASVAGMPLAAWIGETLGWRAAFAGVAALAAAGAWAVWRAMPDGVRPPAMSRAGWAQVATHPALLAMVAVTLFSASGQFTLFAYLAPYYRQVLEAGAAQVSGLFFAFGALGVAGNVWLSRRIDRLGAPRLVLATLALMATSLLLWPLGTGLASMLLVIAPWGLACFASNSAQQVRLSLAAPALAPALVALNTSAMYSGQALGAIGGGALLAGGGFGQLHWVGLAWLLAAMGLSLWAGAALARRPVAQHG
ncbi:MAG: MFS transporter [Burkholderiaceae bacterium]|nr:MFS transporter [Burkholderiaceae bacterium]